VLGVHGSGETEVEDAHIARLVEHDVRGFDVSVHDRFGMGGLETSRGLNDDIEGVIDGEWTALLDESIDILARDVLHGHEVDTAILVGVEDGDQVGMAQFRGDVDLAVETGQHVGVIRKIGI
jgi:hypothetical protein